MGVAITFEDFLKDLPVRPLLIVGLSPDVFISALPCVSHSLSAVFISLFCLSEGHRFSGFKKPVLVVL